MEGKKPVKCWIMEQQYRSIKSWVEDGARDPEVHETRTATPAVAVPLEDYMEVRSTMLGTASYHMKDTETPYCRVCGASDGRWPCSARIDADAVLALLPEVPHV